MWEMRGHWPSSRDPGALTHSFNMVPTAHPGPLSEDWAVKEDASDW